MPNTTWLGTTTDGSLDSNWSNGVPDARIVSGGIDAFFGDTTTTSIINFGSERAYGTLTASAQPNNNDTVTIDAKVYTFQAELTDVDGNVHISHTDKDGSMENLIAAITLGAGSGTAYAASTTAHPTCTATQAVVDTVRAVALDAGTGGNSIDTLESTSGVRMSWGAATLQSGTANGGTVNDIDIRGWRGNINASGSEAEISFNKFYHEGWGTVYIDVQNGNRFIVNSPNYALAAQVILSGDVSVGMEFVGGRSSVNWNGLTGSSTTVWIDDSRGASENLVITGTGTIPELICSRGRLRTNGPLITEYTLTGGEALHDSGAITTLRTAGYFRLNSTSTVAKAYVTSGTLTLLESAAAKTVTTVYLSPSGTFLRRDNIDSFTLYEIGIQ
jgi:hypothetical protein